MNNTLVAELVSEYVDPYTNVMMKYSLSGGVFDPNPSNGFHRCTVTVPVYEHIKTKSIFNVVVEADIRMEGELASEAIRQMKNIRYLTIHDMLLLNELEEGRLFERVVVDDRNKCSSSDMHLECPSKIRCLVLFSLHRVDFRFNGEQFKGNVDVFFHNLFQFSFSQKYCNVYFMSNTFYDRFDKTVIYNLVVIPHTRFPKMAVPDNQVMAFPLRCLPKLRMCRYTKTIVVFEFDEYCTNKQMRFFKLGVIKEKFPALQTIVLVIDTFVNLNFVTSFNGVIRVVAALHETPNVDLGFMHKIRVDRDEIKRGLTRARIPVLYDVSGSRSVLDMSDEYAFSLMKIASNYI